VTLRDFSSLTSWYAQPALWIAHKLDLAQIPIPDELFILLAKRVKKNHYQADVIGRCPTHSAITHCAALSRKNHSMHCKPAMLDFF
jgi:hypothetical protein